MDLKIFIQQYPLLILLPFIVQAISIAIDEFYFHHKRGLGLWERVGHPLDTLTVVSVYIFCFFWTFNQYNLFVFIGLAFFSSIFVTKDEFVHSKLCDASEQWLHSILFFIHSSSFVSLGLLWSLPPSTVLFAALDSSQNSFLNLISVLNLNFITIKDFLMGQIFILSAFMIYQIIFWNFKFIKRYLWIKQI